MSVEIKTPKKGLISSILNIAKNQIDNFVESSTKENFNVPTEALKNAQELMITKDKENFNVPTEALKNAQELMITKDTTGNFTFNQNNFETLKSIQSALKTLQKDKKNYPTNWKQSDIFQEESSLLNLFQDLDTKELPSAIIRINKLINKFGDIKKDMEGNSDTSKHLEYKQALNGELEPIYFASSGTPNLPCVNPALGLEFIALNGRSSSYLQKGFQITVNNTPLDGLLKSNDEKQKQFVTAAVKKLEDSPSSETNFNLGGKAFVEDYKSFYVLFKDTSGNVLCGNIKGELKLLTPFDQLKKQKPAKTEQPAIDVLATTVDLEPEIIPQNEQNDSVVEPKTEVVSLSNSTETEQPSVVNVENPKETKEELANELKNVIGTSQYLENVDSVHIFKQFGIEPSEWFINACNNDRAISQTQLDERMGKEIKNLYDSIYKKGEIRNEDVYDADNIADFTEKYPKLKEIFTTPQSIILNKGSARKLQESYLKTIKENKATQEFKENKIKIKESYLKMFNLRLKQLGLETTTNNMWIEEAMNGEDKFNFEKAENLMYNKIKDVLITNYNIYELLEENISGFDYDDSSKSSNTQIKLIKSFLSIHKIENDEIEKTLIPLIAGSTIGDTAVIGYESIYEEHLTSSLKNYLENSNKENGSSVNLNTKPSLAAIDKEENKKKETFDLKNGEIKSLEDAKKYISGVSSLLGLNILFDNYDNVQRIIEDNKDNTDNTNNLKDRLDDDIALEVANIYFKVLQETEHNTFKIDEDLLNKYILGEEKRLPYRIMGTFTNCGRNIHDIQEYAYNNIALEIPQIIEGTSNLLKENLNKPLDEIAHSALREKGSELLEKLNSQKKQGKVLQSETQERPLYSMESKMLIDFNNLEDGIFYETPGTATQEGVKKLLHGIDINLDSITIQKEIAGKIADSIIYIIVSYFGYKAPEKWLSQLEDFISEKFSFDNSEKVVKNDLKKILESMLEEYKNNGSMDSTKKALVEFIVSSKV